MPEDNQIVESPLQWSPDPLGYGPCLPEQLRRNGHVPAKGILLSAMPVANDVFGAMHPYPSEEQKKQLAQDTGLTILQVNNWTYEWNGHEYGHGGAVALHVTFI
ncbi:hypothetical protein CB1_056349002 [Camelus ferus]|nr:hypothetical protein CB1_056349002 [Camelus ferus]